MKDSDSVGEIEMALKAHVLGPRFQKKKKITFIDALYALFCSTEKQ